MLGDLHLFSLFITMEIVCAIKIKVWRYQRSNQKP